MVILDENGKILNNCFNKSEKRVAAEKRLFTEVKAAEESVKQGHYVTLTELHKFLGL